MKITVLGGAGFLGSHVCDKLSDNGDEVTIFDICESPYKRDNQKIIVGDILNSSLVNKAIKGAEAVFNFAGISDINRASDKAIETVKNNILGNVIILDACVKQKVKRYVFASSVYVYSNSGGFYRCSKQACELYIENYNEVFSLEYTILRYGSLYGPRADERNAIYRFVKEALEKQKISYVGSPNALREYIHVEDAARSSVDILNPKFANEHIILTGHQPMRVGDLLSMISEILQKPLDLNYQQNPNKDHYEITPYSFNPKIGKKLVSSVHIDLGQGILKVIEDLHQDLHHLKPNANKIVSL